MKLAYNPKNRNARWPFPTLHVFEGVQDYSNCGRLRRDNNKLIWVSNVKGHLTVVCEHCVYGRPNLRYRLYGGK